MYPSKFLPFIALDAELTAIINLTCTQHRRAKSISTAHAKLGQIIHWEFNFHTQNKLKLQTLAVGPAQFAFTITVI